MQTKWAVSLRYVDTELDRPRWRSTLSYRVFPRLQVGAGAGHLLFFEHAATIFAEMRIAAATSVDARG